MRRLIGLVCAVLCVLGLSAVVEPAAARASSHRSPGAVHGLRGVSHSSVSITLSWTLPKAKAFRATAVRFAAGTHAPKTVRSGHSAAHLGRTGHTLTVSKLRSGQPYAFSVFALDKAGHAGPRVSTVVAVAPAPVTDVRSFALPAATQVTWVNPKTRSFARVVVRVQKGAAAPATPGRGRSVRVTSPRTTSAAVTGLAPGTTYAVSVWAVDRKGGYSTPSITRFTTSAGADPNGTLTGRITDSKGAALSGVEVEAAGDYGVDPSTRTGGDGMFVLSVPADHYTLLVGGDAITGGHYDATGYVGTVADADVRSGHTTKVPTIELAAGAAVTGTIVDDHHKPVAGAYPYAVSVNRFVQADDDDEFFSYDGGGPVGGQPSAADGSFTLLGVPTDGAVHICALPGDSAHSNGCAERTVLIGAGLAKTGVTVTVSAQAGGSVRGTVRNAAGAPVPSAWVDIESNNGDDDVYLSTVADIHGHYDFDGLPPGSYQACAFSSAVSPTHPTGYGNGCSTGQGIVVTDRTTTLNITLPVGAAITGTVTGPTGHPVAQATVQLRSKSSGFATRANSHGQFTVTGADPGAVQVCISTDSSTVSGIATGVVDACWHKGAQVTLTRGRVRSGIDTRLATGAAISGTVRFANGKPAVNVVVGATAVDGDTDYGFGSATQTDKAGHYVIRGLRAGGYSICFDAFTAGGSDVQGCSSASPTALIGHTVSGVDGRFAPISAIDVTVHDGDGAPVAGVDVVAYVPCPRDCDPQPLFNATDGVSAAASQPTDNLGRATLDGIAAGTYAVCLYAINGTTSSGGSPTGYADSCGGSTFDVAVTRGATKSLPLTLADGGAVSGTVTDGAGHGVAGVHVLVSQSAGTDYTDDDEFGDDDSGDLDSPSSYGFTSADGTYTAIGVQPGVRSVCFDAAAATGGSSPAGYRSQCLGGVPDGATGTTRVTVKAGETTPGTDIALTPAAGLSGTVTHGRTGVVGAQVYVFYGTNARNLADIESTGAGGTYTVGGLTPGLVTVCFAAQDLRAQCYRGIAWDGESDPPLNAATEVPVVANTLHPGVDATLK